MASSTMCSARCNLNMEKHLHSFIYIYIYDHEHVLDYHMKPFMGSDVSLTGAATDDKRFESLCI